MPTIGAEDLIRKWGSPLCVAEALLLGKIRGHEQSYVPEVVATIILEAAKFRVDRGMSDLQEEKLKPPKRSGNRS